MKAYEKQALSATPKSMGSSREGGFSLIELMIVVVMVAILAAVSGPSFVEGIARSKRQTTLTETLSMLSLARLEAATRATQIVACVTVDRATCTDTGEWENGYLLFVDNGAGTGGTALNLDLDGTEEIVYIGDPMPSGVSLRTVNFNDDSAIAFTSRGTALERGTFQICDRFGVSVARGVILNRSGQPRLATDESADGTVNNDQGAAANVGCPA